MMLVSNVAINISIHVLRVEDDSTSIDVQCVSTIFQSTFSVWRTTHKLWVKAILKLISIHVLRVEDDRGCPLSF